MTDESKDTVRLKWCCRAERKTRHPERGCFDCVNHQLTTMLEKITAFGGTTKRHDVLKKKKYGHLTKLLSTYGNGCERIIRDHVDGALYEALQPHTPTVTAQADPYLHPEFLGV